MLLYLDQEVALDRTRGVQLSAERLHAAVVRGAVLRLRPKIMTVAVILGGLLPLMVSNGVGMDVMHPVAAPMIGGMITAPLFSLLVVPAIYLSFVARQGRDRILPESTGSEISSGEMVRHGDA
jgi:Cu(I)/Ag(I) efflux system membrane protein CusA/SilA